MKEQILVLADIMNMSQCYPDREHFARAVEKAAIESYKAELLKEVGGPVYQVCKSDSISLSSAWIDVTEQTYNDAGLYPEYGRRILYTFDQVAAAILKATKPLEEEIERLKVSRAKKQKELVTIFDANCALRTQLVAAQEEIKGLLEQAHQSQSAFDRLQDQLAKVEQQVAEWQPIETAPKDGAWIVVTSTHNKYYRACVQFYDGNWCATREVTHDDLIENAATHWMPMPKAPNGANPPPSF